MSIFKRTAAALAALTLPVAVACTPEQEAAVRGLLAQQEATRTCHGAVDHLWPEASRAWAHRIVDRESGGTATAQNRSSSAAGCFQLLSMHAWRFRATGSDWSQRYNAAANTRAALHLYRQAGAQPW